MSKGIILALPGLVAAACAENTIDRYALVNRHNINPSAIDPFSPLSVGNGSFCFPADVTGLQTVPEAHSNDSSLTNMAERGWGSAPNIHTPAFRRMEAGTSNGETCNT